MANHIYYQRLSYSEFDDLDFLNFSNITAYVGQYSSVLEAENAHAEEISNILKRLCISVVALWDSDPGKWGKRMEGIEIGNPDRMRPGQNTVIIASANYEREIGELLEEKGFKKDEDYIPYSELRRRILYFVEENGFD